MLVSRIRIINNRCENGSCEDYDFYCTSYTVINYRPLSLVYYKVCMSTYSSVYNTADCISVRRKRNRSFFVVSAGGVTGYMFCQYPCLYNSLGPTANL
jgi:hypothetical protein